MQGQQGWDGHSGRKNCACGGVELGFAIVGPRSEHPGLVGPRGAHSRKDNEGSWERRGGEGFQRACGPFLG